MTPCGLNCDECIIGLAATNSGIAAALKKQFIDMGHADADESWFRCNGCPPKEGEPHWSEDCRILACCVGERGLENCSQCEDFACDVLQAFAEDGHAHHAAAVERLTKLAQE